MPTALIVEDEPEANALLAMLVRLRGYQAASALTGTEGLALLARGPAPDVVLLDLMLPDTNGYEVCRAIRSRRETCLVPVVAVTARLAEENRSRCYQIGATGFVPKPYTPDQIFRALEAAAAWRRDLDERPDSGGWRLDGDGDAASRELSRLGSLLLARTPLTDADVGTILNGLRQIAAGARNWGDRHRIPLVGAASYRIDPDCLRVEVRDLTGWFAGGDFSEAAAAYDPGLNHVFDRIERDEDANQVVLTRHFAEAGG